MRARLIALALLPGCTCAAPRTEIPTLAIPRATITIDGSLDEWPTSGLTEPFVDTMDGRAVTGAPRARLAWDERALYLGIAIEDTLLRSDGREHDAHLWEADCFEIMLDPDGDEARYLELQVSPRNVVFDTWFDTYRAPQPFGHVDWSSGLESAVHVRGTIGDDAVDEGYTVEVAIPWEAFRVAGREGVAPRADETWRLQMYVLDAGEEGQSGVGWSAPLVGDFHVPSRFARVTFASGS